MNEPLWSKFLEELADNKFVLGDQLVEIGVSAPELSSALAAVAIAQGELGHARHLYNWTYELQGVSKEVKEESGKSLPILKDNKNWIDLMVSVYMVNLTAKVFLQYLREIGGEPVLQKTSKMMAELEEHLTFSAEWCCRFENEPGAIPRLYRSAVKRIAVSFEQWLGKVETALAAGQSPDLTKRVQSDMGSRCNLQLTN